MEHTSAFSGGGGRPAEPSVALGKHSTALVAIPLLRCRVGYFQVRSSSAGPRITSRQTPDFSVVNTPL